MNPPETRYTKSGDAHVAYQVVGEGVHIGERVASKAGIGEILVSRTVLDLAGSGISFEDRGECALKGVPDRCRLYWVVNG